MSARARAGGNSAKASSGISTLTPELGDSADLFVRDILKSGQGQCREDLVETLVVSAGTLKGAASACSGNSLTS